MVRDNGLKGKVQDVSSQSPDPMLPTQEDRQSRHRLSRILVGLEDSVRLAGRPAQMGQGHYKHRGNLTKRRKKKWGLDSDDFTYEKLFEIQTQSINRFVYSFHFHKHTIKAIKYSYNKTMKILSNQYHKKYITFQFIQNEKRNLKIAYDILWDKVPSNIFN